MHVIGEEWEENYPERQKLINEGYLEFEGNYYIEFKVNNNSAEAANNVAKTVLKVKRGVHHKYLQGVLDVISFSGWYETEDRQYVFESFVRNYVFNSNNDFVYTR